MKIAIIGTGNLGISLIKGFLQKNLLKEHTIVATRRNLDTISYLKDYGIQITSDNAQAVAASEIVILALKAYSFPTILDEIRPVLNAQKHTIISLAAGITLPEIHTLLQLDIPLYRAMPNTASAYNQSLTLISKHSNTIDHGIPKQLFDLLGITITINEELMDAGTVLGASGIAFVMRFMRAMTQGGIQIGFDAKTAADIVTQVTRGAAEILTQSHHHPESEIDKVTTPKGCTIVGLNTMEHNGFSSSLIQGIVASCNKLTQK